MSPFAGFPDFKSCVAASGDKKNPEAFCAWLEKQSTGQHSEHLLQGLPTDVQAQFWVAFDQAMTADQKDEAVAMTAAVNAAAEHGWVKMKQGWMRKAVNKIVTRAVYGVPIFAVGQHNGDVYTREDVAGMVLAFSELKGRVDPPVKIGHTSDEFNKDLARKMGIQPEFIGGEKGSGAMAFGWIGSMRLQGNILYADLSDVPAPIADLIESKSYKKLSCEVLFGMTDRGKTYPKVVIGLALLGAELPAVKDSGLDNAAVYAMPAAAYAQAKGKETSVEFAGEKKEEAMDVEVLKLLGLDEKADKDAVLSAIKKLAGGLPGVPAPAPKEITAALGLPDGATIEQCVAKIKEMMGKMDGVLPGMQQKFTDMENTLKSVQTELATERRKNRVAYYTAVATGLKAIDGKSEEIAERLVSLEEKDSKAAEDVLKVYQETNAKLVAAGLFKVKGSPAHGEPEPAEQQWTEAVRKYTTDNKVTEAQAIVALRKADPGLWKAYRQATRPAAKIDNGE